MYTKRAVARHATDTKMAERVRAKERRQKRCDFSLRPCCASISACDNVQ